MHPPPRDVRPDDSEDLANNPWLDSSNDRRSAINQSTTRTRPAEPPQTHISHPRSHTTAGHPLRVRSPSSAAELYSASGHSSSLDLHETCPSLRRVINASWGSSNGETEINGGKASENDHLEEAKIQKDTEVIVHQIHPSDSLPGVALKYNVTLAALRSANKLWANDSIHLRQMLYIPVQAMAQTTTRSVPTSFRPHPSSPPLHSAPDFSPSRRRRSVSEWRASITSESMDPPSSMAQTVSGSALRRVPLSELSFFPPPSSSTVLPHSHTGPGPRHPTRPLLRHTNSSQSSFVAKTPPASSSSTLPLVYKVSDGSAYGIPTFGLTSFINGAKDEIISRLSLDSARGSSDAGREPEVEMDVVSRGGAERRASIQVQERVWDIKPGQNGRALGVKSEGAPESVILNTPRKPKVIRNVQLQPSPRMEIPARGGTVKILTANGTGGAQ